MGQLQKSTAAPQSIGNFRRLQLKSWGRRDSKIYPDHQSGSHTETTRQLENEFQQRQLMVATALTTDNESLLDGIRAIEVRLESIRLRLQQLYSQKPETERRKRQLAAQIAEELEERDNQLIQRIANAEAIKANIQRATHANASWGTYFRQSAAIYQAAMQKAKMKRKKTSKLSAVSMALPVFNSIDLVVPEGFEESDDSASAKPIR
jgi:uncharacterized protein (DUF342 family)